MIPLADEILPASPFKQSAVSFAVEYVSASGVISVDSKWWDVRQQLLELVVTGIKGDEYLGTGMWEIGGKDPKSDVITTMPDNDFWMDSTKSSSSHPSPLHLLAICCAWSPDKIELEEWAKALRPNPPLRMRKS